MCHLQIHDLVIIVPDTIQHTDAGMLYITGGGNHNGPADISASDEDIFVVSQLAVKTGMVGAALFQVPNQRIQFAADPLQKVSMCSIARAAACRGSADAFDCVRHAVCVLAPSRARRTA